MHHVEVSVQSIERFTPFVGRGPVGELRRAAATLRHQMGARVVWNINSTAKGGGVAEILHSHVGFARGLGIDARWSVLAGPPEFFVLTKRLHNALHGARGDDSPIDDTQRPLYERVLLDNVLHLTNRVQPGDFVFLHDPQTAGMIPALRRLGVRIVWRCHVGSDVHNAEVDEGWAFLRPYLEAGVDRFVFSRAAYAPSFIDRSRMQIVTPTIDPTSSKNSELPEANVRAILIHTGIIEGPIKGGAPVYSRDDGTPARVDRAADIMRLGRPPKCTTKLVTQVSRWDRLKDPIGVMHGFARLVDPVAPANAELLLAGPNVHAVADDPEGAEVFQELLSAWRELPHHIRSVIHLLNLPMADVEENAAIVNALQRHSAVIVQKSLVEGFGLTVAEAMWKARPVVASAVGGIQDQIEDGVSGLLLKDPADLAEFSGLLSRLLSNEQYAKTVGATARLRVQQRFLGVHSLLKYEQLLRALLDEELSAEVSGDERRGPTEREPESASTSGA